MKTLFVYYKLSLTEHTTWLPKVQAFQSELRRAWPALQTELMQRPEPNAQGLETWMEVYRQPGGVTEVVTTHIAQLAQQHGLPAPRLSEVFVPLAA